LKSNRWDNRKKEKNKAGPERDSVYQPAGKTEQREEVAAGNTEK
jgi:hypothetical protein